MSGAFFGFCMWLDDVDGFGGGGTETAPELVEPFEIEASLADGVMAVGRLSMPFLA